MNFAQLRAYLQNPSIALDNVKGYMDSMETEAAIEGAETLASLQNRKPTDREVEEQKQKIQEIQGLGNVAGILTRPQLMKIFKEAEIMTGNKGQVSPAALSKVLYKDIKDPYDFTTNKRMAQEVLGAARMEQLGIPIHDDIITQIKAAQPKLGGGLEYGQTHFISSQNDALKAAKESRNIQDMLKSGDLNVTQGGVIFNRDPASRLTSPRASVDSQLYNVQKLSKDKITPEGIVGLVSHEDQHAIDMLRRPFEQTRQYNFDVTPDQMLERLQNKGVNLDKLSKQDRASEYLNAVTQKHFVDTPTNYELSKAASIVSGNPDKDLDFRKFFPNLHEKYLKKP